MILTLLRCATAIGRKLGELLVTARPGGGARLSEHTLASGRDTTSN